MIPLLLALLPQLQAAGLEPGERFAEIAPAPPAIPGPEFDDEVYGTRFVHGRVIDAFTGYPVAGATVESWTEEIDTRFGGFVRVGEAQTRTDGRFSLQIRSGAVRGDKARCYAPGYLTLSGTVGEFGDVVTLFPAPEEPTRIRVLDLRDRPIPGVQFTSTRTCSHDLPAFDATTNACGIAELYGFGLQSEIQELRVRAHGRDAIEYLNGEPAFLPGPDDAPWTMYLPRQRPGRVMVLDREGEPLVHAPMWLQDDECYHVVRSDTEGWCNLPTRYGFGSVQVQMLNEPQNHWFHEVYLPSSRPVVLRWQAEDWNEDVPTGTIAVQLPGAVAADMPLWRVPFQFNHEDGWNTGMPGDDVKPIAFPAGRGFLLFGGPFSGWEEEVIDFELTAGETATLQVEGRRQPRITVLAPDAEWRTLWVQAGDSTYEDAPVGEPFAVTGGQPVCFLLRADGILRRVWIDEAVDGMEIDLRPRNTLLRPMLPEPPIVIVDFQVNDGGDGDPEALFLQSPDPGCELSAREVAGSIRYHIGGTAGTPFLVGYNREGYVTTWMRGRLGESQSPHPPFEPVRYAKVELVADFAFALPDFGWLDLDMLCPGPLNLVLERDDGRRYALELNLEPGAVRRIELTD